MDESTKIVIYRRDGNNCLFDHRTLRRTIWTGWEKSFLTLEVEICGIRGHKWNAKCVIIFQTVILKHVRLVTGAKNICAQIDAQLYSWNSGAFDEIICDSCAADMGYLGRAHRNKSSEQCHHTFSNLLLCGKLREAVRLVCKRELSLKTTQLNSVR